MWLWKSRRRSGSWMLLRYWKNIIPSGRSVNRRCSSEVSPEVTKSCTCPDSSRRVMTP